MTTQVIAKDSNWAWLYSPNGAPQGWNARTFDSSTWAAGPAPLGFPANQVTTNIDTFAAPTDRPATAYFTKQFEIADDSKVTRLELKSLADDGVVIYVNGTEVNRTNMPTGSITAQTFASGAVRTASAQPVSVVVPKNLLVNGTNVISAETHVNYRSTADASFHLTATMTSNADGDTSVPPVAAYDATVQQLTAAFDASKSPDPDGQIASYSWDFGDGQSAQGVNPTHVYAVAGTYPVTLSVTDADGNVRSTSAQVTVTSPDREVVAKNAAWSVRYAAGAAPLGWNAPGFDASAWPVGVAPLGFGDPSVATNLDTFASTSDRPVAAYFTTRFDVTNPATVTRLRLDSIADDGAVIYVNGIEVSRTNMPAGAITEKTFASSAVRTTKAPKVSIEVPPNLLVEGSNVIAVETHLNYRGTPDMSHWLNVILTTSN